MRTRLLITISLSAALLSGTAHAQGSPAEVFAKGRWEFGLITGGGVGVTGSTSGTGTYNLAFRVGKIISRERGSGAFRGNLEVAADVVPVYLIVQDGETIYGASVNPLVSRWNFTGARRVVPYLELASGFLWTSQEVPRFTSRINFTSQAALGMHVLRSGDRSVNLTFRYAHISNAGLATPNPGINTVQVQVGFSWFR